MKRYVVAGLVLVLMIAGFWWWSSSKKPVKPPKARIAIVIDDWGYKQDVLPLLFQIERPVTIAVLPNKAYSKQIAHEAKRRGYQVIEHLPLESKSNRAAEKGTLYRAMSGNELKSKLKAQLKSVPGIVGVNNHQGSRATEDEKMMATILTELKKVNLFFLDSYTTKGSVCSKVAAKTGIRFAQSDIFIDLPPQKMGDGDYRSYVRKNLKRLADLALKKGSAIGIGHDLKITLSVLKDEIPKFEAEGFQFVFLSDLVSSGTR